MALTINGTYTYTKPLNTIYVDSEGNLRDPEVPRARGSILLPEVTAAYPDLKDMAGKYNIVSNDAITVANGRPVNMHLRKAVDEGAIKQAAWAKEHPYLNMIGLATGAAPFAVAATPAIVGGGELAATALANPYVDAGITSAFAGHGLNHAINEGINGYGDAFMTALELTPMGRLAKPLYEGVVQPGMRLFNSPLTGNWTKIGNREYRLNPNSLGANGSPIESRGIAPQLTAENAASMTPKVNWDADNWFKTISGRSSYSSEEAAELASHVPEYRAIEERLFNEGKLIQDSNGNIIVKGLDMSPQEYIMRQSGAFKKMNPKHHYTGVPKYFMADFESGTNVESWTDRISSKNVEEYAFGNFKNRKEILDNIKYFEDIEKQYGSTESTEEWLKIYRSQLKDFDDKIEKMKLTKQGKVYDITYPKDSQGYYMDAVGNHWARIPSDIAAEAGIPKRYLRIGNIATDDIVAGANEVGPRIVHIDNVMDTYDGTLLNETIIPKSIPKKSVLGSTGTFDVKGRNKWKLYRSLIPPFLGLGAVGTLYKNLK